MSTYLSRPLRPGLAVYATDGRKIGDIAVVESDYVIVEKGFIFPDDIYVPLPAVAAVDDADRVHLSVSSDCMDAEHWTAPPLAAGDYSEFDEG